MTQRLRRVVLSIVVGGVGVLGLGTASVYATSSPVRVEGFSTPESVLHDRVFDRYLVSNVGGPTAEDELAADDDGFISRLAPDGRIVGRRWIDGGDPRVRLDSPHGMGVRGRRLYVADLTTVRIFDRWTGRPLGNIPIPGAVFLNDLDIGPDGSVYVTDTGLTASGQNTYVPTGTDAIHRILPWGEVTVVSRGLDLHNPNGIVVLRDGTLRVTAYDDSGEVYTPTPAGGRTDVLQLPGGFLDGLLVLGRGRTLASSGATSVVYEVAREGEIQAFYEGEIVADIGYDAWRRQVLMPIYYGDAVVITPLRTH